MEKQPAVYIMANKKNGTLYTGVTSNLPKRVYEHKEGITKGFASKYRCLELVCYVLFDEMEEAIREEKRLKGGSRKKKLEMVCAMNPYWEDLYERLF
jgi:predicted GIY-YIG superfamily endonuclease